MAYNLQKINGCFFVCFFFWGGGVRGLMALSDSIILHQAFPREGEREKIDMGFIVQPPPPAPTENAVGPCPTIIQISRTPLALNVYPSKPPPAESQAAIYLIRLLYTWQDMYILD